MGILAYKQTLVKYLISGICLMYIIYRDVWYTFIYRRLLAAPRRGIRRSPDTQNHYSKRHYEQTIIFPRLSTEI